MNVRDIPFTVSSEALDEFRGMIQERNQNLYQEWYEKVNRLPEEEQKILDLFLQQEKMIELTTMDYEKPEENMESLREASGKILNSYAKSSPLIIGGAADLASSTMTSLKEEKAFEKESYEGRKHFIRGKRVCDGLYCQWFCAFWLSSFCFYLFKF